LSICAHTIFSFTHPPTTYIYTLSLHDALPIFCEYGTVKVEKLLTVERYSHVMHIVSSLRGRLREDVDCFDALMACFPAGTEAVQDRKSTRLNSSHLVISYAVFCLKKKKNIYIQ